MATAAAPKKSVRPEIRQTQCFIGGKWIPAASGKTFETIHPATEEVIAQVAEGDAEDVDRAVHAAREALERGPWKTMDARDRGALIGKLADLIAEEADELAALESLDNGKPIRDARAADLPLTIDALKYYAGWADKLHGQTIPVRGNYFTYTRREPVGVVGQIIPWNFPMLMVAWKWGPALAAGCTIVMKPAEQTPLTCLRMARLAQKAGIPDGVINVVPGYGPTAGAAIVKHKGVDKVAFTGEYLTAQTIMKDAAPTLKRLTFELGGKSPNVVFADADLDAAIAGAHFGLYFNQGQCCCAGSRLFIEEKVHDEFVDRIQGINKTRKLGDPLDPETEQGPQVDRNQFDKILKYIDLGKNEGAKLVTGGKRWGDRGFYVEPTLFTGVTDEMKIARDEIFRSRIDREQLVSIRDIVTLEDVEWAATGRHRFRAVMVMAFAALALVLAMVGVFGILAYSVQQRVRDFGVRRALGATTGDVLRLVVGDAVRVVVAGAAIGLVLSALLGRLIATMLFGVQPLDLATFALVTIVLALTAAVSIAGPAWRAARIDPAVALRNQ